MNTCAQCRFWKDPEDSGSERLSRFQIQYAGGDWKECTRPFVAMNTSCVAVDSSEGMVTRSDFGCVQFEPIGVAHGEHHYTKVRFDPPCPIFSESEHDPNECKHCGWTQDSHP